MADNECADYLLATEDPDVLDLGVHVCGGRDLVILHDDSDEVQLDLGQAMGLVAILEPWIAKMRGSLN